MPMYSYKCHKCNTSIDVSRKVEDRDSPPEEHEVSGYTCDHEWERIITNTSFHLVGGGWFNQGGY